MKKLHFKALLPQLSPNIFLGIDRLKKGNYTLHITDKEKVVTTINIKKK